MTERLPIFESVRSDFAAGLLGHGQGRHEWRDWQPRHRATALNAPTVELPSPRKRS